MERLADNRINAVCVNIGQASGGTVATVRVNSSIIPATISDARMRADDAVRFHVSCPDGAEDSTIIGRTQ